MTKTIFTALFLVLGWTLPARAATVGVVDSGTDFEHVSLAKHAWVNANETIGNRVDDDRNGKVDDANGWNFADNYHRVFFREHLKDIDPQVYRLFEIIAHKQAGTLTREEAAYWEENVAKLPKEEKDALLARLNFFGGYAHGTHVSGIVAQLAPKSKIMSARLFPDDVPVKSRSERHTFGVTDVVYKMLAALSNGIFKNIAGYVNETKMDVANYSLGASLKMIAEAFLSMRGVKKPTPEQLAAETRRLFKQYEKEGRAWMASAPDTLFVIAAGNDGSDNDVLPAFPAGVRVDNAISVAASLGTKQLADFSNYGKTTVDIAAPGVAIVSPVPSLDRKAVLPMSGTSMASPYVAGVAAQVKELNPRLTPLEIKQILMGTVDMKDWLREKVVAGGVINPPRAYAAARLSHSMSAQDAIEQARIEIADRGEAPALKTRRASGYEDAELQEWSEHLVY